MPSCPALLIAAPASGRARPLSPPPPWHACIAGRADGSLFSSAALIFLTRKYMLSPVAAPCQNLDLGMCGEADARWRLARAAADSDLILIEGVMGLFDGQPSAADIAERFGIPIMALIDAGKMAQTFGAIAHGLASYRPSLPFAGVMANRVGSATMLTCSESLPRGMGWFGALPKRGDSLPERHLGLLQAEEITDLGERLEKLADALAASARLDLPAQSFCRYSGSRHAAHARRQDCCQLRAILPTASFIRPIWRSFNSLAPSCGFSPVTGDKLPDCDAVWLPGGYPELHAGTGQ